MGNKQISEDGAETALSAMFKEAVSSWENPSNRPHINGFISKGNTVYYYNDDFGDKFRIWASFAFKTLPVSKRIKENLFSIVNDQIFEVIINGDRSEITFKKEVYKALDNYKLTECSYIGPCECFDFEDEQTELHHPIISIIRNETAIDRLRFREHHDATSMDTKHLFKKGIEQTRHHTHYWDIKTNSTRNTALTEAKLFADVFMAFFRLRVAEDISGMAPRTGDVEAQSISSSKTSHSYYTLENHIPSFPQNIFLGRYKVGLKTRQNFNSLGTQSQLNSLLQHSKNTLAARTFNALAWYTKGRQAQDFSERVVLFFTALESALTPEAKDSPITEKIARSVGVMVSDDLTERQRIYHEFKKLNNVRSELIHNGRRSASDVDAGKVELYTQLVLSKILEEWDLSTKHSTFERELLDRSFGIQENRSK